MENFKDNAPVWDTKSVIEGSPCVIEVQDRVCDNPSCGDSGSYGSIPLTLMKIGDVDGMEEIGADTGSVYDSNFMKVNMHTPYYEYQTKTKVQVPWEAQMMDKTYMNYQNTVNNDPHSNILKNEYEANYNQIPEQLRRFNFENSGKVQSSNNFMWWIIGILVLIIIIVIYYKY